MPDVAVTADDRRAPDPDHALPVTQWLGLTRLRNVDEPRHRGRRRPLPAERRVHARWAGGELQLPEIVAPAEREMEHLRERDVVRAERGEYRLIHALERLHEPTRHVALRNVL